MRVCPRICSENKWLLTHALEPTLPPQI